MKNAISLGVRICLVILGVSMVLSSMAISSTGLLAAGLGLLLMEEVLHRPQLVLALVAPAAKPPAPTLHEEIVQARVVAEPTGDEGWVAWPVNVQVWVGQLGAFASHTEDPQAFVEVRKVLVGSQVEKEARDAVRKAVWALTGETVIVRQRASEFRHAGAAWAENLVRESALSGDLDRRFAEELAVVA